MTPRFAPHPRRRIAATGSILTEASRVIAVLGVVTAFCMPVPAAAWDPSTTHQGILERALEESQLHARLMAASAGQRGLFTPLRVDADRLTPAFRSQIVQALRDAHADSGATGQGGPHACPGPEAPPQAQRNCVEGNQWELTALAWLRLGIIAETGQTTRFAHHFVARDNPRAKAWTDPNARGLGLTQWGRNDTSLAGLLHDDDFIRGGPSASAWLTDAGDPLAPPAFYAHLEASIASETRAVREHELALALLCMGSILHVTADLAVPAHARGDVRAFFSPLTHAPSDRGLPLAELARVEFGRTGLPKPLELTPRTDAAAPRIPVASRLDGVWFGEGDWPGLAPFASSRFLSERALPPRIDPASVPAPSEAEQAKRLAARLLEHAGLQSSETTDARLAPWPSPSGYILTRTGRPLAAFRTAPEGYLEPFLDEVVQREVALAMLPRAIEATRSVLDLAFPAPPEVTLEAQIGTLEITLPAVQPAPMTDAVVYLFDEDHRGKRRLRSKARLGAMTKARLEYAFGSDSTLSHPVFVLRGTAGGAPVWVERVVVPLRETSTRPVARPAP